VVDGVHGAVEDREAFEGVRPSVAQRSRRRRQHGGDVGEVGADGGEGGHGL
jgi:hypothetical protein